MRLHLTAGDLSIDGAPPIRISDIGAITGLSRWTILSVMERGDLHGFRMSRHRGSPWLFERHVVAEWLASRKIDAT